MDFLYPLGSSNNLHLRTDIPVLSFFTGAGFLDIGFMRAGFNMIWRNEADPLFIKNFEHGMMSFAGSGEKSCINAPVPIESLRPHNILSYAFHNLPRPDVFGIIGGPPCPDFSVGGKNRGREGDHGRLLRTYIEHIAHIKPTFFVLENVLGLVRTTKHRTFLREVLDYLADNYAISVSMLNSLEFGVAQDRYRIFVVGFRRDWLRRNSTKETAKNGIAWRHVIEQVNRKVLKDQGKYHQAELFPEGHWYPWPVDYRYLNARTKFQWPGNTPFRGDPLKVNGIPDELMVGPLICDQNEISSLANGEEGFKPHCNRFEIIDEGDVSRKSFKRLHRWRFSPTAAYGNNEVHLHPTEPRRITVREALRIQSVPDSYEFPQETSLSSKFKMIGNGVPVRLAEAVGLSVAHALKGNFYQQLILNPDDGE